MRAFLPASFLPANISQRASEHAGDSRQGDGIMGAPATIATRSTATTATTAPIPVLREVHIDQIEEAAKHSHAASTRRNYAACWKRFASWCEAEGHQPLPAAPETLAAYLTDRAAAGLSMSSVRMDAASIRHHHASAGLDSPTTSEGVRRVLRGLTRMSAKAGRVPRQAKALTAEGLAAIKATAHLPRSGPSGRTESPGQAVRRGRIDYALACVMFDGLLRRSEAAALTWSDITFEPDGSARLTVRMSKTDQEGSGAVQYLSRATARALKRCRALTDTGEGSSVFRLRSGSTVYRRLKAMAHAAGLDGRITGHSPRIGCAQALVAAGKSLTAVMVAGRWESPGMPAHYSRGEAAAKGAVASLYGEA